MIRFNDLDIRARTILIAVLPTMVMALVLITYFTSSRLSDLEEVHSQRGKALARQLAALGRTAAKAQVDPSHLPAAFDIGET